MPELEYINRKQGTKAALTLRDFLCEEQNIVSEYLSLSITHLDGHICVGITTTDANPITYTAIIPNDDEIDLTDVQFVKQSLGLTW